MYVFTLNTITVKAKKQSKKGAMVQMGAKKDYNCLIVLIAGI